MKDTEMLGKLWTRWTETKADDDWIVLNRFISLQEQELEPVVIGSSSLLQSYHFWCGVIAAFVFIYIWIEVRRKNG